MVTYPPGSGGQDLLEWSGREESSRGYIGDRARVGDCVRGANDAGVLEIPPQTRSWSRGHAVWMPVRTAELFEGE
jgi:hypothetical protein